MNISSTTLSRLSVGSGGLALVAAIWAAIGVARSQNPVVLFVLLFLIGVTTVFVVLTKREETSN